jgi:hypothetical protein
MRPAPLITGAVAAARRTARLPGSAAVRGEGRPRLCEARQVPVASLRVYEPLAAFEGAERERWSRLAASGQALGREAAERLQHEAAVRALVGRNPRCVPAVDDSAWVVDADGVTLVCPWQLRERSWEALLDFREGLPEELADAFVPRDVAEAAEVSVEQWRSTDPDARTHVLTCTWQVPLRWFVLVEADERSVSLGEGAVRTGRELVYRTAMSRARRRTARALSVLRRTVDDGAVTQGVEELARWLEEFHPRSMVELDYGGLVHLLDDAELQQDESARDVADALAALAEGDPLRAASAYARVTSRMKALQAVETAS